MSAFCEKSSTGVSILPKLVRSNLKTHNKIEPRRKLHLKVSKLKHNRSSHANIATRPIVAVWRYALTSQQTTCTPVPTSKINYLTGGTQVNASSHRQRIMLQIDSNYCPEFYIAPSPTRAQPSPLGRGVYRRLFGA